MKQLMIAVFALILFGGCAKEVVQTPPQQPIIINPRQRPDVIIVPGRAPCPPCPPARPGIHIDINSGRPGYHCCPGCGVWIVIGGHHHCPHHH
jgi:hypothetical protein